MLGDRTLHIRRYKMLASSYNFNYNYYFSELILDCHTAEIGATR
jgi:hypothetical protein